MIEFGMSYEGELTSESLDLPQVRISRVKNQREWEETHEVTFGLSFRNRISQVRKQIYKGYSKLVGQAPDDIRAYREKSQVRFGDKIVEFEYVGKEMVAERTNKYFELMDELYYELRSCPEDKIEAATYRFIAVMNTLGMLIHPYSDGNGQTLRLLSLSYLHELVPDTSKLFFPYKSMASAEGFAFRLGFVWIDNSSDPVAIGRSLTDMVDKKTTFLLTPEGKKLLTDYVMDHDTEEMGLIVERSDKRLYLLDTLRDSDCLVEDIKNNLKNWISLDSSFYAALELKNQSKGVRV